MRYLRAGFGAQRLSASLEFTHSPQQDVFPRVIMCSTPFGIIGIHTIAEERELPDCPVLNAFRHHWNSHSLFQPRKLPTPCAQRLSASLEFTLFRIFLIVSQRLVLNAFRHHWNSHALPVTLFTSIVLCSTPFGIIGIHTHKAAGHSTKCLVLCSTPFGIIGIHTLSRDNGYLVFWCVLNAFRHHWNSHTSEGRAHRCVVACAQRLSASLEFTHLHSRKKETE